VVEWKTVPIHYEKYVLFHNKIIKAIAIGNRLKAGNLMRSHSLDASRYLMEVISNSSKR